MLIARIELATFSLKIDTTGFNAILAFVMLIARIELATFSLRGKLSLLHQGLYPFLKNL